MEITCPNCTTRFAVPENAVGPNGRKVRCSHCNHVWHATPEDLTEFTPEPLAAALNPQSTTLAAAPTWETPPTAPEPMLPRDRRLPPPPMAQPRRNNVWLVVGILLIVVVAALYVFRVQVVERLPQAAEIYRLAGVPIADVGTELKMVDVQFSGHSIASLPQIRVQGLIHNESDEPLDVPALELMLLDRSGATLTNRVFQPPQARIDARGIIRFQYDLDGDASEVGSVNVRLQE